jgi:hypothetical protein
VAPEATAFSHRHAAFHLEVFLAWTDPADDDKNMEWLRTTWDAAAPFLGRGVYVNNIDRGEGAERVREAYGSATYDRLAALKTRYDPTNLFRLNQNRPRGRHQPVVTPRAVQSPSPSASPSTSSPAAASLSKRRSRMDMPGSRALPPVTRQPWRAE